MDVATVSASPDALSVLGKNLASSDIFSQCQKGLFVLHLCDGNGIPEIRCTIEALIPSHLCKPRIESGMNVFLKIR